MEQRKKVLITNLYFQKFTGSELHVLEFAHLFKEKGYDVVIAVYKKSYPLLQELEEGITVIECQKEALKEMEFEIVFIQHFPVFDYLVSRYGLKYKRMVVSKLSVINAMENLPVCTQEAAFILCVSPECADMVAMQVPEGTKIRVFQNCVEAEYFEGSSEYAGYKRALDKIAIISNHIPQELLELKEKMGGYYQVDLIGLGYRTEQVNAEFVQQYDLVITIGRTVPRCLAMGVPVYVYDYLGGPGYLTEANFSLAERNNFSGRGFEKKTSDELLKEIKEGYGPAGEWLPLWQKIAAVDYQYASRFDEMYEELMASPELTECRTYYSGIEAERMKFYSDIVSGYISGKECQESKCYYDIGNGFCEEDSETWPSMSGYKIQKSWLLENAKMMRFDPCNAACRCEICSVKINGRSVEHEMKPVNAVSTDRGKSLFLTDDPQYLMDIPELDGGPAWLEVEYRFDILSEQEEKNYYCEKIKDLEEQLTKARHQLWEERRKATSFGMKKTRK